MSTGPGKYDDICTHARESAKAEGAMVIIYDCEVSSDKTHIEPQEKSTVNESGQRSLF